MTRTLKAYRVMKNLTQEDMAKKLKISITSYNKKENGKVDFTLTEAKTLAEYFGISIESLFFETEVLDKVNNNVNNKGG